MEPDAKDAPAPRRRGVLVPLILAALALTLCCGVSVVAVAMRQRIRTAFSTLDARLVLQIESEDPAVAAQTRKVLRERLRRVGLPGRLTSGEGRRIELEHRAQDGAAMHALATTRGELRFLLVVDGLTELERRDVLAHVQSVRRPDGTLPDGEPRDVLSHGGELLVLERPGIGGAGTFKSVYRALDGAGRPAVGFVLEADAARRFRELTARSVDRRLAIVLDGQVRSAPTIRSEIGARGIVEGGSAGWSAVELEQLIGILSADPLPSRLVPVSGE